MVQRLASKTDQKHRHELLETKYDNKLAKTRCATDGHVIPDQI